MDYEFEMLKIRLANLKRQKSDASETYVRNLNQIPGDSNWSALQTQHYDRALERIFSEETEVYKRMEQLSRQQKH